MASLEVKKLWDDKFKSMDYGVFLDGTLVFAASTFPDQGYGTIFWGVDPSKSRDDYLNHLVGFHDELNSGDYESRGARGFPIGVMLKGVPTEEPQFKKQEEELPLSLETLANEGEGIKSHGDYDAFILLRVDSDYAAFTMEDLTGPWKPETGKLSVVSHQDISESVSRYIAETARVEVNPEELQTILAEIYKFEGPKID